MNINTRVIVEAMEDIKLQSITMDSAIRNLLDAMDIQNAEEVYAASKQLDMCISCIRYDYRLAMYNIQNGYY